MNVHRSTNLQSLLALLWLARSEYYQPFFVFTAILLSVLYLAHTRLLLHEQNLTNISTTSPGTRLDQNRFDFHPDRLFSPSKAIVLPIYATSVRFKQFHVEFGEEQGQTKIHFLVRKTESKVIRSAQDVIAVSEFLNRIQVIK